MRCPKILLFALLVNCYAYVESFGQLRLQNRKMMTALRLLSQRSQFLSFGSLPIRRSFGRSKAKIPVTMTEMDGDSDTDEESVRAPSYTYLDLPEETLYILDGTSMIFTAYYRLDHHIYWHRCSVWSSREFKITAMYVTMTITHNHQSWTSVKLAGCSFTSWVICEFDREPRLRRHWRESHSSVTRLWSCSELRSTDRDDYEFRSIYKVVIDLLMGIVSIHVINSTILSLWK